MWIKPFRYNSDNLAYVVHDGTSAIVVDGGAVTDILTFIDKNRLSIQCVINTHGHPDHTMGNERIMAATGAPFIRWEELIEKGALFLGREPFSVIHTPGHTRDSLTFHFDGSLITGDTLFNGTVGNCFSGDLESFFHSIERLLAFPDETRIHAGHDYVRMAMAAARQFEPDNPHIDAYLRRYDPNNVVSTLAEERRVNPFLRWNEPAIVKWLMQEGMPTATSKERWISFMRMG